MSRGGVVKPGGSSSASTRPRSRRGRASPGTRSARGRLLARALVGALFVLLQACGAGASAPHGEEAAGGQDSAFADGIAPAELRDGCRGGDGSRCFLLGVTYHQGLGHVPVDVRRAISAFARACELGALEGCERAFDLYAEGTETPRNPARALHYADIACAAWEHGRFERTSGDPYERDQYGVAVHCCALAKRLRGEADAGPGS